MRVTQKSMYNTMSGQMNSLLSDYMESNMQGGTLKKINRPSDDPAGMARILSYRSSIGRSDQYMTNSDAALGWLNRADSVLGTEASNAITQIRVLAQQAKTETNGPQREIIAGQLREALQGLLNLANSSVEGKHIFGGQDYANPPYRLGLTATGQNMPDNTKLSPAMQVTGDLAHTAMVRFPPVEGSEPPMAGTVPPSNTNYRRPDPDNAPTAPDLFDPAVPTAYEWSEDGGKTWQKGSVPVGSNKLVVGGATVTIPQLNADGSEWDPATLGPAGPPNALRVKPYDKDYEGSDSNGSTLIVRPAVIYQASDNNAKPVIGTYGNNSTPLPPAAFTSSFGQFSKDTLIKFDGDIDLTDSTDNNFTYTYSTDGGTTWQRGRGSVTSEELSPFVPKYSQETPILKDDASPVYLKDGDPVLYPDGTAVLDENGQPKIANNTPAVTYAPPDDVNAKHQNTARMVIPGGYVDISVPYEADAAGTPIAPIPGATVSESTQLVLRPQRSDLSYEILPGQHINVNNVGKDIFGGLYKDENGDYLTPQFGENDGRNLFETVGRLIAACETNNTEGIGQGLADIELSLKNVLAAETAVGAKVNRVQSAIDNLENDKLDQQTRMGNIEDVNITDLMIKLSQQQMAYNTVLKSSSMIMQMNLMQYL